MALSNQAYVIDAVRTAVGKRNGSLAGVHPVDLAALGPMNVPFTPPVSVPGTTGRP